MLMQNNEITNNKIFFFITIAPYITETMLIQSFRKHIYKLFYDRGAILGHSVQQQAVYYPETILPR